MVSLSTFKPGEALVHSLFLQNLNLDGLYTDKLMSHGVCSTTKPEFYQIYSRFDFTGLLFELLHDVTYLLKLGECRRKAGH